MNIDMAANCVREELSVAPVSPVAEYGAIPEGLDLLKQTIQYRDCGDYRPMISIQRIGYKWISSQWISRVSERREIRVVKQRLLDILGGSDGMYPPEVACTIRSL